MTEPSNTSTAWVGIAFPAMVSARVVGAAISPLLFAHLPVLLIVMSPFLVHLVVVAPLVTPAIYFPITLVVTTAQALIGFYFGHTFGQRALTWLLDRVPISDSLVERGLVLVRKASIAAIFAVPGPVMGTVAGVAGVRKKTFAICVAPAQAIWITAAYFAGEALLDYIEIIRHFVIEHALALTGVTITIVLGRWLYTAHRRRHRGGAA